MGATPTEPPVRSRLRQDPLSGLAIQLLQLALLGALVGLACWPLNLLDRVQGRLLTLLPAFGGGWSPTAWALMLAPLAAMPLLLLLQSRLWPAGAGSGLPQILLCLEQPERSPALLGGGATLARLCLWAIATLALLPLGREGPVVQLGAAVAMALRRRWPALLAGLSAPELMAAAGGVGLAAGFNTPLVGVLFMAEDLAGSFAARLLWPTMVMAALAALISSVGGQPEFALGELRFASLERDQMLWAVPIGLGVGLLGALFGRLLLALVARLAPAVRRRPLLTGLGLGAALAALTLISGGAGAADGQELMVALLRPSGGDLVGAPLLLARLLAPCLALGAGVPGGLIDPALSLGALVGRALGDGFGIGPLGLTLGMAACLAGATQLPLLSLVFSLRLAGDQQQLPGLLLAAVLGAYVGRLLIARPLYHQLAADLRAQLTAQA
jgi:H+/Cl- antiporter ClcA